ncbi:MAG: TerB family tellurite resistance protein [Proteobacteria bacterium]|nr:TerB family tellurite resistance protein [Pseudomonadota bacterium]
MGWLGKVVGGAIGFALAGPIGAVAGATFGHGFDISEDGQAAPENQMLTQSEKAQMTFFVAAFSMLAKLAKADGHISDAEIKEIDTFMITDLEMNSESRKIAVTIFRNALKSEIPFIQYAEQFHGQFKSQQRILELMIDIMLRVSTADGNLGHREEQLILSAVNLFHFSPEAYRIMKSRYVRDVDKYYDILGINKNDSKEDIKKKYRKLVSDYHPDVIASKGLPDEFLKFAHDKFIEIQEAYEMVKKEKGIQ